MTEYTKIKLFTHDIKTAAIHWGNSPKINLQGEKVSVSLACQTILRASYVYDRLEKSPQRRIETFGDLSSALKDLATRVGGVKSWPKKALACIGLGLNESEKCLWTHIAKIKVYKDRQTRFFLIRLVQAIWDRFIRASCETTFQKRSHSKEFQFKECAFRIVKNLGVFEEVSLDPKMQGAPPTLLYRSVLKDLEQFLSEENQLKPEEAREIRKLLWQLKFGGELSLDQTCIRVAGNYDSQERIEEKMADLAYKIEKQVERLKIGQSLLLPSGYITGKSGHGIVFEIQRMNEHHFQFVIYNTGNGATLGMGLWGLIKTFWYSAVEPIAFQNLSKEAVSDQNFLMDAFRFVTNPSNRPDPMADLFFTIREYCVRDKGATETRLNRHELQSWGTCAFDSIRCYLKAKLDPDLFARFEAHMMQKTHEKLNALLPEIRASGVFNQETCDFVEIKSREAAILAF